MIIPIAIATFAVIAASGGKRRRPSGMTRPSTSPGSGRVVCGPGRAPCSSYGPDFTGACVNGYCQRVMETIPVDVVIPGVDVPVPSPVVGEAWAVRPPEGIAKNGYWIDTRLWWALVFDSVRLHKDAGRYRSLDWNDWRVLLNTRSFMLAWTAYTPSDARVDTAIQVEEVAAGVLTIGITAVLDALGILDRIVNVSWPQNVSTQGAYADRASAELWDRMNNIQRDPLNLQLGISQAGDEPGSPLRFSASNPYVWVPPYGVNKPATKPSP